MDRTLAGWSEPKPLARTSIRCYILFLSQRDGESHVYRIGTEAIEKLRPGKS